MIFAQLAGAVEVRPDLAPPHLQKKWAPACKMLSLNYLEI